MNIQKAHESFSKVFIDLGQQVPTLDEVNMIKIGILNLNTQLITFVADWNYIFANGLAIASTSNDNDTAVEAFANALKLAYENKFVSDR